MSYEYDVDKTFNVALEEQEDEARVVEELRTGKRKFAYVRKTTKSGHTREIEIYPEFTRREVRRKREISRKQRVAQKNLNDRNARRKLQRLIECNFGKGDLFITLTYDNDHLPESMERAVRNMQNYVKKLNRHRRKKKLKKARYIYITEWNKKKKIRCHHHVLIDGEQSMDELERLWPNGRRNNCRRVDEKSLDGLAAYLSKDPKGKKRWNASKGLKKPKVTKNHQIRKKHLRKMLESSEELNRYAMKFYPTSQIVEARRFFNEINNMVYIYIKVKEMEG